MKEVLRQIDLAQQKKSVPEFGPGDTIRLYVQSTEGQRRRSQKVEGIVIKRNSKRVGRTVTIRSVLSGVGVERSYQVDSPLVEKIEVVRRGQVRRARLYYLRGRSAKGSRVRQRTETQAAPGKEPNSNQ
jgi:large subunit ribosomal protein L19